MGRFQGLETDDANFNKVKIKNYLIWAAFILALYSLQALLYVPQTYFANVRANPSFTWLTALVVTFIPFYIFALLTPPVIWLGLRFPFERKVWLKNAFLHLACSLVFAVVHLLLLPVGNTIVMGASFKESYKLPIAWLSLIFSFGAGNIIQYWSLVVICQAIMYFRKYREREHNLTQAQLQALKTQLNPHFLFNTLNAISELVYEDAEEAEKTISKLSELLRLSLKSDQAQEIALCDELEFLRMYVEIQQTLLQERLKIEWRIAPETLFACVPNMILQPLVENSIRHGIAPRSSGGTIKIESARQNGDLVLKVEDDGLGIKDETKISGGIGLQNTRTRLLHLYGEAHEFVLQNRLNASGTAIEIKLPFRENKKKYDDENSHFNS